MRIGVVGGMNHNEAFAALQEGDVVQYDARRMFMDPPKWVEATFIRWLSVFPAPGVYCTGVINKAVLHKDGVEFQSETVYFRIP